MPVKIVLRKRYDFSPFRRILNLLLQAPLGDTVLLCSGYIWQPSRRYNILNDGLRNAILNGCANGELITVAGKFNPGYYSNFYHNFINDLRRNIKVRAYYAPRKNWHAKVALRLANNRPVAGIIGSSNLTRPAYGENWRNWNYEADVLIWIPGILTNYFQQDDIPIEVGKIELILNPDIDQPNEESQLQSIYDDIMGSELEEISE